MMKKGKNNMKTSMSWDGWQEKEEQEDDDDDDDDDDDEELEDERFFEPMDRISSVDPINLENDEEFDDFDDSRMSFASAMPAPHRLSSATISDDAMNSDLEMSHYDVWMAEPGSISERRMRLLEGMGLCGNNTELVKLDSNIEVCSKDTVDDSNSLLKAVAEKQKSTAPLTMDNNKNKTLSSPLIVITRSKSDAAEGNSKRHRCQELLGSSSPPPLARRTPSAPSSLCHCHGESLVRGSATHMSGRFRPSPSNNSTFFCKIKNLDTGKEFIVNEDGTWNCLSDLETGQQLTMEEFERCVGYSPIVKELMRRENVKTDRSIGKGNPHPNNPPLKSFKSPTTKKRGGWLKNIKGVANSVSGLITTDSYSSSPGSSSMERSNRNSEWMKVRHHGKPYKELTGLYMCQEIHAHQGSIWSIRFSPDAGYLASAGEDRTIHVWQVIEGEPPLLSALEEPNFTPARTIATANASLERPPLADGGYPSERRRRGKVSYSTRKSTIPDYVVLPDTIFSLSDKPICSFRGHQDDVLDISWSNSSELLLSSSMDKTVRLWDMKSKSCLKLFAHNDYVTCIQFNPVDERYFISGSLDAKVRIWSIPDRQVVDWNDLHEMVTAACYTPDGQGALVGSHTGSCRLYSTSDCKLRQKGQIEIQNKKKKSHAKKITGFQFAPGSSSEVLITSADSQIRIFDGVDLIHKFRGFRNTSSQIAASFTGDGKYVVCASEDSQVYIWKREEPRSIGSNSGGVGGGKSKGNHVTTRSHEHFHCRDVSLAIPWPGSSKNELPPMLSRSKRYNHQHLGRRPGSQHATLENAFMSNRNHCPPLPRKASFSEGISNIPEDSDQMLANPSRSDSSIGSSSSFSSTFRSANNSSSSLSAHAPSPSLSWRWSDANGSSSSSIQVPTAWGLAIVTAGLGGEIRVYQNFGLPI